MTASVELREFPGERLVAKVIRTSRALDPATRTLRTELHLPNKDGRLLPGMYAQVKLSLSGTNQPLLAPASTLVIDSTGRQLVTLDSGTRIARAPVRLGRDFGREIEVVGGVTATARLVVSPRDDLRAGEEVTVVQPATPAVASR